ncbi:retromer complex subunit Vps35 [Savitreella phatthalungensis]
MSTDASASTQDANTLEEALAVVRGAKTRMIACLDTQRLMDALKHASTMLAEMKTSTLGPKQYYELYMAVFDALGFLSSYLVEAHKAQRHHLADLYELVQYAGSIVPRLYLMITVGSAYMSMADAPVREIMRDMMEMSRGVQHPTRGLFLRYYLSGKCRDSMPIGTVDGPAGNLQDSITFTLTNFIEMNKLWVRLQHQGHSRDRHLREVERSELKTLVGTNLVRLSQLDGIDLDTYSETLLPAILEQVVQCRDVLAQEYLLEVVTQVFPDDWHLHTLQKLLSTISKLNPHTDVKGIIIQVIDRLAAYAAAEADAEPADVRKKEQEQANEALAKRLQALRTGEKPPTEENLAGERKKYRGIPVDVPLFDIFWDQVSTIVGARSDLKIQDVSAMLVSLCNLSMRCYPAAVDNIDQIFAFARDRTDEGRDSTDLHSTEAKDNLLKLLLSPIEHYPTLLSVLAIPSYVPLLQAQSFAIRRSIAGAVAESLLENGTPIDNAADAEGVFGLLSVVVVDPEAESANGAGNSNGARRLRTADQDSDELIEEQGWLARIVHQLRSDDVETQAKLLQIARRELQQGGDRIRYTYPSIITGCLRLARELKRKDSPEDLHKQNYRFIHQTITQLHARTSNAPAEPILRQYLFAAQVADEGRFEEFAYEFFAQAFSVYEESISESRAQFNAVAAISSALQMTRSFSRDNYDTLITKCALHGAKLLKKPDQVRAILLASHLWWQTELPLAGIGDAGEDEEELEGEDESTLFRDDKRVLECLQKALKIADACMDAVTSCALFVEILDRYVYYYDHQVESITPKFVSGLVDLVTQNLASLEASEDSQDPSASKSASASVSGAPASPQAVRAHFHRVIDHIKARREDEDGEHWREVDV